MEIIKKTYAIVGLPIVSGLDEINRKLYVRAGSYLVRFNADTMVNEAYISAISSGTPKGVLIDDIRGGIYVHDSNGDIYQYSINPFAYTGVLGIGFGLTIIVDFMFFNADKSKLICIQNSNPVLVEIVNLQTVTVEASYTVTGVTGVTLVDINFSNDSIYIFHSLSLWRISLTTFVVTQTIVFTSNPSFSHLKIDPLNNLIIFYSFISNNIRIYDSIIGTLRNSYTLPDTFIADPSDMVIDYLNGYLYFAVRHRQGMMIYKLNYLAIDKLDTYFLISFYTANIKLTLDLSNKRNRVFGYAISTVVDEVVLFNTNELTSSFAAVQSEMLLDYIDEENNLKPLRLFGTKANGPKVEVSKLPTVDIDYTTLGSPITITATETIVIDMKLGRKSILLYNEGPNPCRIGKAGVTFAGGFLLPVRASITLETNKTIYAICATGLTTKLSIEEELYT